MNTSLSFLGDVGEMSDHEPQLERVEGGVVFQRLWCKYAGLFLRDVVAPAHGEKAVFFLGPHLSAGSNIFQSVVDIVEPAGTCSRAEPVLLRVRDRLADADADGEAQGLESQRNGVLQHHSVTC